MLADTTLTWDGTTTPHKDLVVGLQTVLASAILAAGGNVTFFDTCGELLDVDDVKRYNACSIVRTDTPHTAGSYHPVGHLSLCRSSGGGEGMDMNDCAEMNLFYDLVLTSRSDGAWVLCVNAKVPDTTQLTTSTSKSTTFCDQDAEQVQPGVLPMPTEDRGCRPPGTGPLGVAPKHLPMHQYKLTDREESLVQYALGHGPSAEVLRRLQNIPVTRRDIQTLRRGRWLNDEVINFLFKMLAVWNQPSQRCYVASSLFYSKLVAYPHGYCYENVRRWTMRLDITKCELVVMPIFINGNHWTVVLIHQKEKRILYYDSCGNIHTDAVSTIIGNVVKWLQDVGVTEASSFEQVRARTPVQHNSWDCGIFMLFYVYYLALGMQPTFTQDDCDHLRKCLALAIMYVPRAEV